VFVAVTAGRQTPFEAKTYQLGPKPKAALAAIDQITTDEIKQHREEVMKDAPAGTPAPISKVIEDEGIVVVRTTPQGHRRIAATLAKLRD